MPARVRIQTVEFRSLLLPPIHIPLRALHTAVRPRCAPAVPHATHRATQSRLQCRSLHLYKTARSKTLLGQHKLLTFTPYEVAPPSQSRHKVNLVKSVKDPEVVASDMSLQELYDNHMGSGKMLYLTQEVPKRIAEKLDVLLKDNIAEERRNFAIMEPYSCIKKGSKDITLRPTNGHQLGELKCIMLRLSNPPSYFQHCLDRAYQFVAAGSPVEFRIRLRGSTNKEEKKTAGPIEKWQWMHDHWPHLRPDFILKSMPEGSTFLINPVSDGYIVQFVVSLKLKVMPTGDLNNRLWKVKTGVEKSLKSGKQSQLPQFMRQDLFDQGLKDYSPHSGLPKAQALAGYTKDKSVAKWELEEGEALPQKLFSARSLENGRQTLISKGGLYQPDKPNAYPEFGDAEAARRARREAKEQWRAREKAEEEWRADVRRGNTELPPVDKDFLPQRWKMKAFGAEKQGQHSDSATEHKRMAQRHIWEGRGSRSKSK